ncbi:MAG: FAD-dependent oxidoreductase [Chthoniobacterales bacterium]
MKEPVAIIGAGVSGLTCAALLAEHGYRARILAEEIGSRTTSGAAAAIWFPYDAEPFETVIRRALRTYEILRDLAMRNDTGVSMIELRLFSRAGDLAPPPWAVSLGPQRLPAHLIPSCFTSGFTLQVPLTDTTRYLDYLAARFRKAGGRIEGGVRLQRLQEIHREFGLIVNCTGLGAKTLVPDPQLEAHRGQVAVVPKLPIPYAVVCDDPPLMYAIPRSHDCVLGGTNDLSDNPHADALTTAGILSECRHVLALEIAEVLDERVGLRPFRPSGVCLRSEKLADGRRLIHNYGHGGSGFTLSWGCAEEVWSLAESA